MTEEKPSFVLTYTKERENTPNMPTRTLSPVYFPSIARKDPLSATQLRTSTTVPNTSININKSIEKTDNNETKSNNKADRIIKIAVYLNRSNTNNNYLKVKIQLLHHKEHLKYLNLYPKSLMKKRKKSS